MPNVLLANSDKGRREETLKNWEIQVLEKRHQGKRQYRDARFEADKVWSYRVCTNNRGQFLTNARQRLEYVKQIINLPLSGEEVTRGYARLVDWF